MALDANGRRLLVTSGSVRAPIYQVMSSPFFHPHTHLHVPGHWYVVIGHVLSAAFILLTCRRIDLWLFHLWATKMMVTCKELNSPTVAYQVRGHTNGMKTLPHCAAITTVDWHPTLPIFLTGSADHSVRVTSISWRFLFSIYSILTGYCQAWIHFTPDDSTELVFVHLLSGFVSEKFSVIIELLVL